MNKIFVAAFAGLLCFSSCNNSATVAGDSKENSVAQKNLEASRAISKAFETGNTNVLDSVVADDFLDHTERGDMRGRDSLKAMVTMVHNNMKDMKSETIKDLADNEYVFSWMRFTGTSDGSMGMAPGPYDMQSIEVAKFRDGKAIEHWSFVSMKEMMEMMGAMQGTNNNMNMNDTTKMKK
jgi:predicted SnoaL-like aldol condensation-catalyzing enzyme